MSKHTLLFCFPFAGGTTDFYNDIEQCLSGSISVIKLEYSGHGKRCKEKLYDSFDELADDLYIRIKEIIQREYAGNVRYALLGYSMGSISVMEILKRIIQRNEISMPQHVFLAAHEPLSKVDFLNCSEDEIDQRVIERTIKFGGIPDSLKDNRSFWRIYLPMFRSDYLLIANYDFEKYNMVIDIPATVFYSNEDTKFEDMILWNNYFARECEFVEYTGNHFFIKEHFAEMAKVIRGRME